MRDRTVPAACCTTPSAMCYWTAIFLLLYGATLVGKAFWPALRHHDAALILAALGLACAANVRRNGTLHCMITAPLFLAAGAVALLTDFGWLAVPPPALWGVVLAVTGLAFLVEWRLVGGADGHGR